MISCVRWIQKTASNQYDRWAGRGVKACFLVFSIQNTLYWVFYFDFMYSLKSNSGCTLMWVFMLNSRENFFPQRKHSKAFSPECTSWCRLSLDLSQNTFLQIQHLYESSVCTLIWSLLTESSKYSILSSWTDFTSTDSQDRMESFL